MGSANAIATGHDCFDDELFLEVAAHRAGIPFSEVSRAVDLGLIRTQVHWSGRRVGKLRDVVEGVNRLRVRGWQ